VPYPVGIVFVRVHACMVVVGRDQHVRK
jgi:hypothetical protein